MTTSERPRPLNQNEKRVLEILQTHKHEHPDKPAPYTLTKLGKEVGITREGARQIYIRLSKRFELPRLVQTVKQERNERIKNLVEQRGTFFGIANRLKITDHKKLTYQLRTLFDQKQISKRPTYEEERAERREVLEYEILHMREKGYLPQEIIKILHIHRGKFDQRIRTLYDRGEIPRIKPNLVITKRTSHEEAAAFDEKVKELRESGLTHAQIAEHLGFRKYDIANSIHRLKIRGEIEVRKYKKRKDATKSNPC